MNAAASDAPFKLPAGVLALAVHAAFFALLYFGFTWQTQAVRSMSVELWRSLPEVAEVKAPAPEVATPIQPEPAKPVRPVIEEKPLQPANLTKPDIALPDKKEKPKVEVRPLPPTPAEKKLKEKALADQKLKEKALAEQAAAQKATQQAAQEAQEKAQQAARDQASLNASRNAVVDEYKAKIIARIRRNIVKPPDVRDDAQAIFDVTLLPGGAVLSAEIKKSSGNVAYDNAVERAILKSDPLPLPPDATLFPRFRELKMTFRPTE
ncbi:MAG: cell envelope integrity protein TolA [Gallionella sp.]